MLQHPPQPEHHCNVGKPGPTQGHLTYSLPHHSNLIKSIRISSSDRIKCVYRWPKLLPSSRGVGRAESTQSNLGSLHRDWLSVRPHYYFTHTHTHTLRHNMQTPTDTALSFTVPAIKETARARWIKSKRAIARARARARERADV